MKTYSFLCRHALYSLYICACVTIFAGSNSMDDALNQYKHAAVSCDRGTYSTACANLLGAVQSTSYEKAQIAYETVCSTAVLFNPFPYALAAVLGIANVAGKGNPFSLLHTGIHFFSASRSDNGYRYVANVLAGVGIAYDISDVRWALNYFTNRDPSYIYAVGTCFSAIAFCLTLYASREKRIIAQQRDLLLEKFQNIVAEKASPQVAL